MLLTEALVASALVAASLTLLLSLVVIAELTIRAAGSRRRREAPLPVPGRVLRILREDYRGRHSREPAALRGAGRCG